MTVLFACKVLRVCAASRGSPVSALALATAEGLKTGLQKADSG